MNRICLLCFVVLLATVQLAVGQTRGDITKDLKFKHFTSADGLSQRSVTAILQDKKGFLWFGTRDGLNKFDGHSFVVYRHKIGDSTSLSNNNIHSIYEDSHGNLWIGTQSGLNKYNAKLDKFIQYRFADRRHTTKDNIIWGIIQVAKDALWIATENGILLADLKTDKIKKIATPDDDSSEPVDLQTRYFLKSTDGKIWICRTKYIEIYDPAKKTSRRLNYPQKSNNNTHLNDLPTLFIDQNNALWLGYEQGLAIYDPFTDSFVDFEFRDKKNITSAVRSICEDHFGNLWIGSYAGLYILNPSRSELKHIVHDENNPASLSQNSIYKILRDSRGDLWIGTWADGINYYNRDNGIFQTIPFGNTNTRLNYKVVSGIDEDRNKNLWIGTEGGGLNYYDRKTKKFSYYKHDPKDPNSLSANNVKAVVIDRNDNLWVGMHDGGLNRLDLKKKSFRFEQINFPPDQNISLKAYKVLSLCEDKHGNIWVGTLTGGLIFYDTQKRLLSRIDRDIKTVMSIVQTQDPEILLIGGNNGLEAVNINTKKKTKIPLFDASKKEIALYINCIFIDHHNQYWLGTEGQGLYVYNPQNKTSRAYETKDGLPNDIVYGILSDNNRNIWISTNNGISQIKQASNIIKNYNQSDGLQGNEFNYGSFYKTSTGELFFGGTNGLTYFDPQDLRQNVFVPPIHITGIDVNNVSFTKNIDSASTITLRHNENNFSIEFTSLSYMRPEKNEFAYILEGNDENWNYIGNQRRAVYTNIKPGKFTFKVIGANNDGIWNEQGATLHIHVLPAPWKTWWAYTLYVVLAGSLFLYIRKLIRLRIKEKQEKERLEESNQLRLSLFTDISHDFRTPLTLIISPLEKMVAKKLGDDYIRQQHDIMLKSAKMLLQLVNQILDFRKSESGKLTLQLTKSNIMPLIEDVKKSFDALAEKKNIRYRLISRSDDIQVWFDRAKLKNILFNLLSNAFKFSKDNSSVTIYVSVHAKRVSGRLTGYVKISVVNFGPVIPKEHLKLIFEQFYQLDHPSKSLGSGIGLSLTKRLIELHDGEITVSSSESKGTRFTVLLKLGDEHFLKNEHVEYAKNPQDDSFSYGSEEESDHDDLRPEEETNTLSVTPLSTKPQNLLIVEDNIDLQHFITKIFKDKYNIFAAENGRQAIEITLQHAMDLIISDVSMPDMDGFELCDRIKRTLITSHIPVILLTAKTSPTDQKKGYYVGADAYVTKPFNVDILEMRVDNLLKTRASLIRKFKSDLILKPKELTITSPDETFLARAITIVEDNISHPEFNVSTFIDQMNMSRTVIYTKLKALTGQNLSTFIRTIRLKKAAMLLSQTSMNISQVAYEVGFNDLKYFRESFREQFGVSPSEYKKQQGKSGM